MSKHAAHPLHIEWTPTWTRAANVQSGQNASAANLSELSTSLRGQSHAVVGVGHSHVFVKTLRLPKASPADLRNILSIQLGQLFPLPAEQLSFDFVQTADHTVDGWLTVVAAIRSELLRDLRAELREVGIVPLRILPMALASPIVAARVGLQDAVVAEETVHGLALDVVESGFLRFSRSARAGSDAETEAKRTMAAARAGDLELVAVGALHIDGAHRSEVSPLDVLGEAPHFNFELMEERLQAAKSRLAGRMRLAAIFGFVAFAVLAGVVVQRVEATATVARSQSAWGRALAALNTKQATASESETRLVGLKTALKQAFHPAQPISDIASVVDDSLPPGAWLTGVTMERGKAVDIRGTAAKPADVALLVDRLGASPRFRDVQMLFANSAMIGQTPVVQFDVSATAIGNLPLPTPPKQGVGGFVGAPVASQGGQTP